LVFRTIGLKPNRVDVCPGEMVDFLAADVIPVTEDLVFSNGAASTSFPILVRGEIEFLTPGVAPSCEWTQGMTGLVKPEFVGNKRYSKINARISYQYAAYRYQSVVPADYPSDEVIIEAFFGDCPAQTLAVPFETPSGLVDVTIHLKSACDNSAIAGAIYRLYHPAGVRTGYTDDEGRVTFTGLEPGAEIPIQWEAANYLNSWEDDLCNDVLVVPNA